MAIKYKKVQHKVLAGADKDKVKTYAMAKTNGVCDLQKLCKLISARSTVSSADVKAVLDCLNWVMDLELQAGNVVQVGELGNFRFTLSSEGTENEKDFNASKIRRANLVFTPGRALRLSRNEATFELYGSEPGAGSDNGNASGGDEDNDLIV
ncbi:MAG: hypothetical protein LIP00_09685 [Parabacteroides sp.]|nr:hypothetical protein [Parabacteroides sp.]